MGITSAAMELLCYYKKEFEIDFSNVAMLGRQTFVPDRRALKKSKFRFTQQEIDSILNNNGYSECFFSIIGARDVCSFDYSAYEGATHLHDFNLPISNEFKNKYSLVYDGGTMEHIFNYPVALRNAMEICEIGGCIVIDTPCNNWCGHGLYQFSPDIFFGTLCSENGFELLSVSYYKSNFPWTKKIINLKHTKENIESMPEITNRPTTLSIVGKKISEVPEILTMQQTLYKRVWLMNGYETNKKTTPFTAFKERHWVLNKMRKILPNKMNNALTDYLKIIVFEKDRRIPL